jgi:hypothetical protein
VGPLLLQASTMASLLVLLFFSPKKGKEGEEMQEMEP